MYSQTIIFPRGLLFTLDIRESVSKEPRFVFSSLLASITRPWAVVRDRVSLPLFAATDFWIGSNPSLTVSVFLVAKAKAWIVDAVFLLWLFFWLFFWLILWFVFRFVVWFAFWLAYATGHWAVFGDRFAPPSFVAADFRIRGNPGLAASAFLVAKAKVWIVDTVLCFVFGLIFVANLNIIRLIFVANLNIISWVVIIGHIWVVINGYIFASNER